MKTPADRRPDVLTEPAPAGPAATPLLLRIFWYGVAGVVTLALNPALFTLFHNVFGWVQYLALGASLTLVGVLQFVWSYHVGFRTQDHWTTSARRQGATLLAAFLLSYALGLLLLPLFPLFEKTVLVAVQVFVAGVKFVVYHYWVYPDRTAASRAE